MSREVFSLTYQDGTQTPIGRALGGNTPYSTDAVRATEQFNATHGAKFFAGEVQQIKQTQVGSYVHRNGAECHKPSFSFSSRD